MSSFKTFGDVSSQEKHEDKNEGHTEERGEGDKSHHEDRDVMSEGVGLLFVHAAWKPGATQTATVLLEHFCYGEHHGTERQEFGKPLMCRSSHR